MPVPSSLSTTCPQCERPRAIDRADGLCFHCLLLQLQSSQSSATTPDEALLPPGYESVDRLGEGGMGEVYLAFQPSLARYVALKRLSRPWLRDARAEERFLREARAAGRLSHSGIVPVLEAGRHGGAVWYTMEYVEGGDLAQLLNRQGGRLPWAEAVGILVAVTEAIQHAHAAGVAHRDLKPSNILLTAEGRPKVADFGLAWLAAQESQELTATGEILGTPAYLPPEALSTVGRDTDPRLGDLYSLGALLFHLVAGRPPFSGSHPAEILHAIAHTPAPRLAEAAPGPIPRALDELCAVCLRKSPGDRFASAAELLQALRACQAGGHSRLTSWRLRRPALVRLLAAAGVILIAGYAVRFGLERFRQEPAAAIAPTPVIAIATIEARTPESETALVASGLQDEVAATLTRITDVRVIARRSLGTAWRGTAEDFRTARTSLGVGAIVTGSVAKFRDKLRIVVHLIDTSDGSTSWAQTYTRDEANLLNLETDIATDIALHFHRRPRPTRPDASYGTTSTVAAARDGYAHARALLNDASDPVGHLIKAEALLSEAVEADPGFAAALAQLSLVHTRMYNWGNDRSQRRLALGLDAAQRALRLNPDLPEAEIALGNYYYRGSRDYATAYLHFQKALTLVPNHPECLEGLAQVERRRGNFTTAADHYAAALVLDPLNANLAYNTVDTFFRLRRYDECSALLEAALTRIPRHPALIKLRGDLHVAWHGDLGPTRDDLEHRGPDQPTPDISVYDRIDYLVLAHHLDDALATLRASKFVKLEGQSIWLIRDGFEASLLQLAGRRDEARAAARRALPLLEQALAGKPNDSRLLLHLGEMEAINGSLADAERRIARLFTPGDLAAVDAFDRGFYLRSLAILQANAGADDHARATLRTLLGETNQTSKHYLALHPALQRFAKEFP